MAHSHLKRKAAPKTWPILRKTTAFITRPKPSGSPMELSLPVVVALRELLGLVETAKQARTVLRTSEVLVNGKRVYDVDSAVSFMDVLTANGENHRVVLNKNMQLTFVKVKKDELMTLRRIMNKTQLKGGKTQLNGASGWNMRLDKNDYKVGDTLAVDFSGKVVAHYPLEKGAAVIVTGGTSGGMIGTIESVTGSIVSVSSEKHTINTIKRNVYVVGKGKSAITLH